MATSWQKKAVINREHAEAASLESDTWATTSGAALA